MLPIKINEHESVTLKGCDGFPGWRVAISFFLLNHASYVTAQRALMPANVGTQEKHVKNSWIALRSIAHLGKLTV